MASEKIAAIGHEIGLIYSLALPMEVLRKQTERQALVSALDDAPYDAIWLKTENFGDDASGEKAAAFIDACRDFHARGLPVIADHVGGLPGLGALASGAVSGLAHGVTMNQRFKAASWRRSSSSGGRGLAWRVYLPQLDLLLKPEVARAFLETSTRVLGRYGCRNTLCCPSGIRDMIGRPARNTLFQQAREIEEIGRTPQAIRITRYLDEHVRRVSDNVAAAAGLNGMDASLQTMLLKKQRSMSRFRDIMAKLGDEPTPESVAPPVLSPTARSSRTV